MAILGFSFACNELAIYNSVIQNICANETFGQTMVATGILIMIFTLALLAFQILRAIVMALKREMKFHKIYHFITLSISIAWFIFAIALTVVCFNNYPCGLESSGYGTSWLFCNSELALATICMVCDIATTVTKK